MPISHDGVDGAPTVPWRRPPAGTAPYEPPLVSQAPQSLGFASHQGIGTAPTTLERGPTEATPKVDHIRDAFANRAEPISVYQVETDIQEAEVAAALWLGAGAGLSDPIHLLRIPVEDAEAIHLQLHETPGGSDVRHVDTMHRDLGGDFLKLTALANRILARSRAGEDMVRTVAGLGLSQRIADFLDSAAIGSISIRKAKRALATADQRGPGSDQRSHRAQGPRGLLE